MDLAFNQEQSLLKEAARQFLEKECSPSVVRRIREGDRQAVRELWSKMAELGWLGLPFSEAYGGLGGDGISLAALVEELGRVADPTPYINSIIACGTFIEAVATESQKRIILPRIIEGDTLISLALLEDEAVYQPGTIQLSATAVDEGLLLNGSKRFVENADIADYLLVAVRTSAEGDTGITTVLVDTKSAGIEMTPLLSVTLGSLSEVTFYDVKVEPDQIVGVKDQAWPDLYSTIRKAAAFQSVEAAGGAARVLEMTVAYARERQQFGQPIGAFQAVQHILADRYGDVETAWLAAYEAIAGLTRKTGHSESEIALAKVFCGEAFTRCCLDAHQIFAGMGYIWETDLHFWTRKAKEIEFAWGTAMAYRKDLARYLQAAPD